MNAPADRNPVTAFHDLTPDVVMDLAEDASGVRCTGTCRPLNSYINRVYELGTEDDGAVVAKFFRPGRWSREALEDELQFVHELEQDEIPVVPPLPGEDGALLHDAGGLYYAVYPRRSGRVVDEPSVEQWLELGRLIGRMHVVGARCEAAHRVRMTPDEWTEEQIDAVLDYDCIPEDLRDPWIEAVEEAVEVIAPFLADASLQRVHGDLHCQNLIHRPGEGLWVIDFDDMAMGPAVQDLWMLLPGRLPDALPEARLLLEGYETFREFDRSTLRWIEPLRFMRFVHFTAWCAMQAADGGFKRLSPEWGTDAFWREEIRAMRAQLQEIRDALDAPLPHL